MNFKNVKKISNPVARYEAYKLLRSSGKLHIFCEDMLKLMEIYYSKELIHIKTKLRKKQENYLMREYPFIGIAVEDRGGTRLELALTYLRVSDPNKYLMYYTFSKITFDEDKPEFKNKIIGGFE